MSNTIKIKILSNQIEISPVIFPGTMTVPVNYLSGNLRNVGTMGLNPDFLAKVMSVASLLGISFNGLLVTMSIETGGTFSTSIQNGSTNATGLIQFMPDTARGMGTSVSRLASMNQIQQMDYVYKFLLPYRNLIKTPEDVYIAVAYPALLKNRNLILPANVQRANPNWGSNIYTMYNFVRNYANTMR